ncbi:hypothetical protein UFOVP449_149 [uncultured Caudovirales phage]|uniref:Uncharacterized protein n=1 Tax=uncultured Caudovirales phage TaxID=2100421 RepID=A0A6J5M9C0_9CAUD|nr:hypothetical protein UFOVP449_149 [uncultured Caudovirales phage]
MQNEQQSEFELVDPQPQIQQAEWCFQFFDNEPVVFAYSKSENESSNLVIELRPTVDDTLTFAQNGMVFKIFPREMTEETKKLREKQYANQNQEAAQ